MRCGAALCSEAALEAMKSTVKKLESVAKSL